MKMHIDVAVTNNCQNPEESFGEICVHCNKCGRFGANSTESEGGTVEVQP